MNKTFFKGIVSVISVSAVAGLIIAVPLAFADGSVPATSGSDSISGATTTVSIPSTSGSDSITTDTSGSTSDQSSVSSPATSSVPVTSPSDSISGSGSVSGSTTAVSIPVTSGSDSISNDTSSQPAPTVPVTSGSNSISTATSGSASTGGSSSGSDTGSSLSGSSDNIGGGFSSGGNGGYIPLASPTIAGVPCPYLSDYIVSGADNSTSDVAKLQAFLRNLGGSPTLPISGVFDAQTVTAVKLFQTDHAADILAPWGVTTPTGQVYLTTLKKINEIACNTSLPFTSADQSIINAYKANLANGNVGQNGQIGNGSSATDLNALLGATSTGSDASNTVGENTPDNSALTANVTTSGLGAMGHFFSKIFSAIAHFFGKK